MSDEQSARPAFATGNPEQGGHTGMTLYEYEMIAYRAAALTGLMRFSGNWDETANQAEHYARAMYDAAHPEESE